MTELRTGVICSDCLLLLRIPCSSVLDELQLSDGLLWKAGEETITILHPADNKGMNKFSPNLMETNHLIIVMLFEMTYADLISTALA